MIRFAPTMSQTLIAISVEVFVGCLQVCCSGYAEACGEAGKQVKL